MFQEDINNYKLQIQNLKPHTKNMRILLVEDHKDLHHILFKMFQALFLEVGTAYNGKEALELYKNNHYDLVFSDIVMPKMDGVTLATEIKNINPRQEIIILSAHQESPYLLELINLGIRRFIPKPAPLGKILSELQLVCDVYDQQTPNIKTINKDVYYHMTERNLYVNDTIIALSPYEVLIIELLISKLNTYVSNQEIVEYFYLHLIDVHIDNIRKIIYKLRKKLPHLLIQNTHALGYSIHTKTSDT